MANLEGPFTTTIEDYNEGFGRRLDCDALHAGRIYTLMARGRENDQDVVIKTASTIYDIQRQKLGIYVVQYGAFLDADMQPLHKGAAEFLDGKWIRDLEPLEPGEAPVDEAYFRRYADDGEYDNWLRRLGLELSTSAAH